MFTSARLDASLRDTSGVWVAPTALPAATLAAHVERVTR